MSVLSILLLPRHVPHLFMQGKVYSRIWVSRLVEPVGRAIVVTSCWVQVKEVFCKYSHADFHLSLMKVYNMNKGI